MRILSAISLSLVLLGVCLFAGCSQKKTVVVPGGGKMTVKEGPTGRAKEVTIENEKGKVQINTESGITEKEMGMPFYPGAEVGQNVAVMQGMEKEAGAMKQVALTTPDSVDKVKAFYLKTYPKASTMDMNSPEATMSHLTIQEGKEQKLIIISRKPNEDKTQIVLHFMTTK